MVYFTHINNSFKSLFTKYVKRTFGVVAIAVSSLIWVPLWAQSPHIFAGTPRYNSEELTLLENEGYFVGYSEERKNPLWVAFRLRSDCHQDEKYKRTPKFSADPRTQAQVQPKDYTHSGYSRGHMAPSLAIFLCYGKQAQNETYLMSNIVPQLQSNNGGIWAYIEKESIRKLAKEPGELYVVTGPVFDDDDLYVIGNDVEIPAAFYKIFVRVTRDQPSILALLIPHENAKTENLPVYVTTVRYIEELTGIDFFNELPQDLQDKIENQLTSDGWGLFRKN